MNQWDEAARKAAESIDYDLNVTGGERTTFDTGLMEQYILTMFADLRATYEKLVEFADWCVAPVDYDNPEAINEDYAKFERLKSDPLIVKAIERHNDKERGV